MDQHGRRFVDNVGPGDLWFFPAGIPHSIQGLEPDGCEFILAWQFWISGQARMTVFAASGRARTFDFHAGDVGAVPRAMGHYIENTGNETVRYLELFRSNEYAEVSLTAWAKNTPHEFVAQHLNIDPVLLRQLPDKKQPIVPA